MKRTIEIAEPVYARLASHAKGFDTPSDVIARLLDSFESTETSVRIAIDEKGEQLIGVKPRERLSVSAGPTTRESNTGEPLDNAQIQVRISRVLMRMSTEDIEQFCSKDYSKQVFGINFPLLVKVEYISYFLYELIRVGVIYYLPDNLFFFFFCRVFYEVSPITLPFCYYRCSIAILCVFFI